MSALKVAAAQIECRSGDIAANVALHLAAIDAARRQDVDVLVFPELSLTDYLAAPDCVALARGVQSSELSRLAMAAGQMAVSVGFIEISDDSRFFNTQVLLQDGQVLHAHRKVNLASYGRLEETRHYARGRRIDVAALKPPWLAATLICADSWNPALPWLAAIQQSSLLLLPVASSLDAVGDGFDNPAGWDVNLRHTALTYGLPTIMANHCGTRGGRRFWGGSRILDASGLELARAGATPALIVAALDYADVGRARARLPTIRDADPELVRGELARLMSSDARFQGLK
jgi:predicted amidohydrolase